MANTTTDTNATHNIHAINILIPLGTFIYNVVGHT